VHGAGIAPKTLLESSPMFPIEVPASFRIIAHRGASGYAPENTVAAFDLARQMGAVEVETDTQLASDGAVVLCHDYNLDRFGHPDRVVESSSSQELATLDMGSWFSPHLYGGALFMTLGELYERYGDAFVYHVELKGQAPKLPDRVLDVVTRHGMEERTILTSFDYQHLARARQLDAGCRLGWLVDEVDGEVRDRAKEIGVMQLCPRAAAVSDEMVEQCRYVVEEVRAWGLGGSPAQVADLCRHILEAGCDGATINWPDWLSHV
jgi:glycerophosphoryl diester phosphodiesterase